MTGAVRADVDAKRAQWEAERQAIKPVQALREELEQVRRQAEDAERRYELNRAAELRYGRLAELERRTPYSVVLFGSWPSCERASGRSS